MVKVLKVSAPHKQADGEFLLSPVGGRRSTQSHIYLLFVFIYLFLHPHQKHNSLFIYLISVNSIILLLNTLKNAYILLKIVLILQPES